jgi:dihydroxyacetone kinase
MVARFGKARVFQERSVGVQDGGATAVYYMVRAAAEYIGVAHLDGLYGGSNLVDEQTV